MTACFSLPYVHDRFVSYLYGANLEHRDFQVEHRKILEDKLLEVAVKTVGKRYYTGLELADSMSPPLSSRSQTLSKQCR